MDYKTIESKLREIESMETERLVLRRFTESDAENMFEYASDNKVTETLTWTSYQNIEECRDFIKNISSKQAGMYAIVLKGENKVIGSIDIRPEPKDHKASIGYVLSRNYWNKGYTSEALKAILEISFEKVGFNRIEAEHYTINPASGKVMEKCAMKYEGTAVESAFVKGKYMDCVSYGITRKEFKNLKSSF